MKRILKLKLQLTQTPIYFCIGEDKYTKLLKKEFGVEEVLEYSGRCTILTKEDEECLVIGIRNFNKNIDIYEIKGLITHEIVHAVSFLMEHFNFQCDEFRAYTTQWLYQEIVRFYDKQKKSN